jgi:hypothetical protein
MILNEVIVGTESFASLSGEKVGRFLRPTAAALKSARALTMALER